MNCIVCNKEIVRGVKYCSRLCHLRTINTRAKGICKTPEKVKAAAELYNSGMLLKEAARQCGTSGENVRKWAKTLGIDLRKPTYPQREKKAYDPNKLILEEYKKDERKLNRLDNLWSRHPAVNCWMAHWKDKRMSCERAKKKYEKNKHRPEYKITKNLGIDFGFLRHA